MLITGYSHAHEYEADAYALNLLARAGYSPASLLDVLRALNRSKNIGGGFYQTHPSPDQRIVRIQGELREYSVQDTRPHRALRYVELKNLTE